MFWTVANRALWLMSSMFSMLFIFSMFSMFYNLTCRSPIQDCRNSQFVEPCSWNQLINQSILIKVDTSSAWYHLFFCAQDLKHIEIKISRIAFKAFLRMLFIFINCPKGNRPFRLPCGSTIYIYKQNVYCFPNCTVVFDGFPLKMFVKLQSSYGKDLVPPPQ